MKTKFCDRVDNVQRLPGRVPTACVRARWTRSVFWWWRVGRDTERHTRSAGGQRRTAVPTYVRARRGLPDACCKLCSRHLGCPRPPGDTGAVHGSCRRDAGCGAGTRRARRPEDYARIIDEADLVARQRVLTEMVSGAGRPDQTSNRAGGQHRFGVSARHAPGILEEDMGAGGVQDQLRFEMSAIWRASSADTRYPTIWLFGYAK